ncbi:MAG TPA: hypothetical protein VF795_11840 [Desulfuromonadaceae bacterium]
MPSFLPSLDPAVAAVNLEKLLSPHIDPAPFQPCILRLRRMFAAFAASAPPPWPAPGLALTPESHFQSELWLPIADIRPVFWRFYRAALRHPPILSSTPFGTAQSWAAIVAAYPALFPGSGDPAALVERLLADAPLQTAFLFRSFLPTRFYGAVPTRYPAQMDVIAAWLADRDRSRGPLRCLDAACGDGAGSYGLARLLLEAGYGAGEFGIEGWTIDPLEVWAAAHAAFPHDPQRQSCYREWVAPVFERGGHRGIVFRAVDLRAADRGDGFDLILCNGLLGGPIVHQGEELQRVAGNLAALLRPGGLLLAADRFHGGWKKQIPAEELGDLFRGWGLAVQVEGGGISGLRQR